jgi:hypothetical protein
LSEVWQTKSLRVKIVESEDDCRSGGEDTRDGRTVEHRAAWGNFTAL